MKSRLLLILVIAVFAQAKTMAADTMSPQVFRDTVIVQSDSVSHHHRCVIKSLEERSIVLWVVDGVIYDNIVVDAEDISEPAQVLIEKTLRKNGIDFGKLEGFNTLPGNIATSVYPNYGKLNGAIIITTENSKLKKKKEE
jgi:hypothetical protein